MPNRFDQPKPRDEAAPAESMALGGHFESRSLAVLGVVLLTILLTCATLFLLPILLAFFLLQGIGESRPMLLEGIALLAVFAGAIWFLVRSLMRYWQNVGTEEPPPLADAVSVHEPDLNGRQSGDLQSAWTLYGVVTGLVAAALVAGVLVIAGILVLVGFGPLSVAENRRGAAWLVVELLLVFGSFLVTWVAGIVLSAREGAAAQSRAGRTEGNSHALELARLRKAWTATIAFALIVSVLVSVHLWRNDREIRREDAERAAKVPPYLIQSVSCRQQEENVVVDVMTKGEENGAYEMEVALTTPPPSVVIGPIRPVVTVDSTTRVPVWRARFPIGEIDSAFAARRIDRDKTDSLSDLKVTATLSHLNPKGNVRSSVVSVVTSHLAFTPASNKR